MGLLNDFKTKPFADQMNILTQIGKEKNRLYLPELFTLYRELTGDKTVDAMVEHTLRDVLSANEADTVRKLFSGAPKEKRLCLQVTGREQFASAVPALVDLVKNETDPTVLSETFIAMAELRSPHFKTIFRQHLDHENEVIAGISIQMSAVFKDTAAGERLETMLDEAETGDRYETCTVAAAKAVEALGALDSQRSLAFLVSKIHHRNPTARRLILEELAGKGDRVPPLIRDLFADATEDQKIMATNLIGLMGSKKGGDVLLEALDRGLVDTVNVRTAIYEAFGGIHSLKGLVCLVDALDETEPQVLITVLTALEHQVNGGVIDAVSRRLAQEGPQSDRLIRAIINAGAVAVFDRLYDFPPVARRMVDAVLASNDPVTLETFAKVLEDIPGDRAKSDLDKLASQAVRIGKYRILAVDDSRAMRLFYRSLIAKMDIEPLIAENGQAGLDLLAAGEHVDLIVTDLNMPVMDGIEFTRKLREHPLYRNIPIIMGTTESENSQEMLARKSGVDVVVNKPINPEILTETIRSYLS